MCFRSMFAERDCGFVQVDNAEPNFFRVGGSFGLWCFRGPDVWRSASGATGTNSGRYLASTPYRSRVDVNPKPM